MSVEENKALVRRGFEAMQTGNLDWFDEILTPDFINYTFPDARGPAGFKQVMGMFLTAFPDMTLTVEDVIGEGDKVATRGSFSGTHTGDFMGIPATGKSMQISYSDIWRIENGKAAENWVQMDMLGMLQQLGVAPSQ
jgi:steroid delta-isomerase-like uncharacterized protein